MSASIPSEYRLNPVTQFFSPIKKGVDSIASLTGDMSPPKLVTKLTKKVCDATLIVFQSPAVKHYVGPIADLVGSTERFIYAMWSLNSLKDLTEIFQQAWRQVALTVIHLAQAALSLSLTLEKLGFVTLNVVKNFITKVPVWKIFHTLPFGGIFDLLNIVEGSINLANEAEKIKNQNLRKEKVQNKIQSWSKNKEVLESGNFTQKLELIRRLNEKTNNPKLNDKVSNLNKKILLLNSLENNKHANQEKIAKDLKAAQADLNKIHAKKQVYSYLANNLENSSTIDATVQKFFAQKIEKWEMHGKANQRAQVGSWITTSEKIVAIVGSLITIATVLAFPPAIPFILMAGAALGLVEISMGLTGYFVKQSAKKIEAKVPHLDYQYLANRAAA